MFRKIIFTILIAVASVAGAQTFTSGQTLTATQLNSAFSSKANNSDLAASSGASLIGFKQAATGAVSRTVQDKLRDGAVSVLDFSGCDPAGVSDSTSCIQAALNASKDVFIPPGVYLVSATLTAQPNTRIYGSNPDRTVIYRTGNYGDTLVAGSTSVAAGSLTVSKLWFKHSSQYVVGVNSLPNKATLGAHIHVYGGQDVRIEDNYFWRMPYSIQLDGGSILHVERNTFIQTYDPSYTAAQEGLAGLYVNAGSTWGNPKDLFLIGNTFLGSKSAARSVTLTDANSNSRVVSMVQNIGPRQAVYINGCETITADGNYFGTSSDADVYLNPSAAGFIANARFAHNFFDGAGVTHFRAQVQSGNAGILHLTIANNDFNGELNSPRGIDVLAQSGAPSVYDLRIVGNTINAMYGAGMVITGAVGYQIANNVITNYNALNVTPSTPPIDAQWASAAYLAGPDTADYFGNIEANMIGGGGNYISTSGNYAWLGFYKDASAVRVKIGRQIFMGVGATPQYGVSEDQPVVLTAGPYTASAFNRTLLANNTAAMTIYLPANAPAGTEIVVKDINNAATYNITINGNGTSTIEGAGTYVMNTAKQVVRLKSNGSNVWYLI